MHLRRQHWHVARAEREINQLPIRVAESLDRRVIGLAIQLGLERVFEPSEQQSVNECACERYAQSENVGNERRADKGKRAQRLVQAKTQHQDNHPTFQDNV